MRSIPAGEFKAKCLAIMDEVEATGEAVMVTKRGKPVVRIGPAKFSRSHKAQSEDIIGFMRSSGSSADDITGPIIPAESWSHLGADKEPEENT